tara:strand:+ start:760 stop:1251 length:492 start_codon:yes stop_codon:yes gene_type:complete
MKLTRKQLIRLIREAMIKPNIPGLPDSQYSKAQVLARHSDPEVRNQADFLASSLGYEGSFSGDIDAYDNPVTRETLSVGTPQGNIEKEIVIPRDMVDNIISLHKGVIQGDPVARSSFSDSARKIFDHIDGDVQPDYVYAYGLRVRGYRAKEYQDAMNAVGEYL